MPQEIVISGTSVERIIVHASTEGIVAAFAEEPVINDAVGPRTVVLIGDADGRTVRAYERHTIIEALRDQSDREKASHDKEFEQSVVRDTLDTIKEDEGRRVDGRELKQLLRDLRQELIR